MSEATGYSVGVDLGQIPFRYATTSADGVVLMAAGSAGSLPSGAALSEHDVVENVVSTIQQLAEQRGSMPTLIALSADGGEIARVGSISRMVAERLGLDPSSVQSLDAASAQQPGAALAAALRGGPHGPGIVAAGAAGVGLGGGTAAFIAGQSSAAATQPVVSGPAGVSIGSASAPGPVGVSVGAGGSAGTAGVPLGSSAASGALGVPVGTGSALGPTGQPLTSTGLAAKLLRLPVVIGTVVAVVAATVVIVVATRDDSPATTPVASDSPVVSATAALPVTVVDQTAAVVTTATPTSLAPAVTSAGCVVGSWVSDNQAYLDAMNAAADNIANMDIRWEAVNGLLRLDIAVDGTVTTTYDGWMMTSTLGGAGEALLSVEGVDTNTVDFAADGTYTVSATKIGSRMVASSSGFVVTDGLSQDTLFRGSSTYSCAGDRLEVLHLAATDIGEADLLLIFVRGA